MASAVVRDKIMLKTVMRQHNIPVVEHFGFSRQEWTSDPDGVLARIDAALGYPVFVKPASLGSSIGVARANNREEAQTYITIAASFDRRIIVEKALTDAIEINCALLGNGPYRASVLEQPITWQEFLTYEEKYMRSEGPAGMKGAERKIPAPIPDELTARVKELAQQAFVAVDGRGTARWTSGARGSGRGHPQRDQHDPRLAGVLSVAGEGMSPADVVDGSSARARRTRREAQTVYNYKTGLIERRRAWAEGHRNNRDVTRWPHCPPVEERALPGSIRCSASATVAGAARYLPAGWDVYRVGERALSRAVRHTRADPRLHSRQLRRHAQDPNWRVFGADDPAEVRFLGAAHLPWPACKWRSLHSRQARNQPLAACQARAGPAQLHRARRARQLGGRGWAYPR